MSSYKYSTANVELEKNAHLGASNQTALIQYCILPIFLYGAETWAVTTSTEKMIDVVDSWCLRCILNIHWSEHVPNLDTRHTTQHLPLSDAVRARRLRLLPGPSSCSTSQHIWHVKGLEEETWLSKVTWLIYR